MVRLLLAGVPKDKIYAEKNETEAVKKHFNPQNIDSVYILYDLYSIKERDAVHKEVKEILEKKAEDKKWK